MGVYVTIHSRMNQPNSPDRVDNYSLEPRSFTHTESEPKNELDPDTRKLEIGIFISAVLASGGFIIYLFDLPGATPKVIPILSTCRL